MIVAKNFSDKTVAVMGLARSGQSSVLSLLAAGATVIAWDDNEEKCNETAELGAQIKDLSREKFDVIDALVLSPGIPHSFPEPHQVVKNARESGVPIIGDLEIFAHNFKEASVIGVTGTNGKATTTALIGHVLSRLNVDNDIAGNIGRPVLELSSKANSSIQVLELSSYQLELAPSLQCEIGILLNISPDHLDRHGGMDGYVNAKLRLFDSLTSTSLAIIGIDDELTANIYNEIRRKKEFSVIAVSGKSVPSNGVGIENNVIKSKVSGKLKSIADLSGCKTLIGTHNHQNAAAATAVAMSLGFASDVIDPALVSFEGLPHRQEVIRECHGISFINDSKATNAEATERALSSYSTIYWIAGGLSKEGGASALKNNLECVRHVFLIGTSVDEFFDELNTKVPCTKCYDLKNAIQLATAAALKEINGSTVVLLSPAAASFDQFDSYEERGDLFRSLVGGLKFEGIKKNRGYR